MAGKEAGPGREHGFAVQEVVASDAHPADPPVDAEPQAKVLPDGAHRSPRLTSA